MCDERKTSKTGNLCKLQISFVCYDFVHDVQKKYMQKKIMYDECDFELYVFFK